jgi:hypothetical protein
VVDQAILMGSLDQRQWRLANRGVTNDAKAPIAEPHNTEIAET